MTMPSPRARAGQGSSPRAGFGSPRGSPRVEQREEDAAWAEACAVPPMSIRTQLIRAGAVAVSLAVLVMLRPELALAYRKLTRLTGQNDNLKRFLPPSRRKSAERQLQSRLERAGHADAKDATIDPDWAWFAPDSALSLDAASAAAAAAVEHGAAPGRRDLDVEASYVGCFGSETWFENRTYVGGQRGARYRMAVRDAAKQRKRYFACARRDADGHGFLFDDLVPDALQGFPSGDLVAGGCERACADEDSKLCGCADDACTGAMGDDQPHHRRWAVYRMPDPPPKPAPRPPPEECDGAWTRADEAAAEAAVFESAEATLFSHLGFADGGGSSSPE